jgi:hypothetical protein
LWARPSTAFWLLQRRSSSVTSQPLQMVSCRDVRTPPRAVSDMVSCQQSQIVSRRVQISPSLQTQCEYVSTVAISCVSPRSVSCISALRLSQASLNSESLTKPSVCAMLSERYAFATQTVAVDVLKQAMLPPSSALFPQTLHRCGRA